MQQIKKRIDLENKLIELRGYALLQPLNITIKQLIHNQQLLLKSYYPNSEVLDYNYREMPVPKSIDALPTLLTIIEPSKKINETDGSVKKKKKTISSTIKKLVWNTNIGEEIGKSKCLCCKAKPHNYVRFA